MNNKKILVLGGTGFIGYHILKRAVEFNMDATSISKNKPKLMRQISDVKYVYTDMTEANNVKKILSKDYNFIINSSGYVDHRSYFAAGNNIINQHFTITKNIIDFANRESLELFINLGSSDEYGNISSPQYEYSREQPFSPYSFAKTVSAHFLEMIYKNENFPCTTLRLFLTYGPYQDKNRLIPQIIQGCLKNRNFPIET